jgi:hypothetical protein
VRPCLLRLSVLGSVRPRANVGSGSILSIQPISVTCPVHPQLLSNWCGAAKRREVPCGRLPVGKGVLHGAGSRLRPCVRPVCAVHMTAGHNALRGSDPGQKLAFDDAMAHCGCCSPSQPNITPIVDVISFTPPVRRVPRSAHPWPLSPRPSWRACSPGQSRRPWSVAGPVTRRAKGDARCHGSWHSG